MLTQYHKSDSRGHANYNWLDTHHTFSFANYYNPDRHHFGALRVLNDDVIKPGSGFDKHPHDNMEIITIPLFGSLMHRDSMGNQQEIKTDEVQVMTAGTGIFHSEFNGSDSKEAGFLQIWIYPEKKNLKPTYDQKMFDREAAIDSWQFLVDRDRADALTINQDARISRLYLSEGEPINYRLKSADFGSYLFIIDGSILIGDYSLESRDGFGITGADHFTLYAEKNSHLINIEIPMNM